jgi:hypothetical protein
MGNGPKIAIAAAALALLLLGSRVRAQSAPRPVTRGLVVGDSIMAHGRKKKPAGLGRLVSASLHSFPGVCC